MITWRGLAGALDRERVVLRIADRVRRAGSCRRRCCAFGSIAQTKPGLLRVRGAVVDLLRRVDDDVVVAAEHDVDAGRAADHALVDLEPEVRDHDDDVDERAEQVDVELRDLDRVERRDAERVRRVEDRREAREVAHADDGDLEPARVEDGERAAMTVPSGRAVGMSCVVCRTCSSPRGPGSSPTAGSACATFSAPRSNSWLARTSASTPIALMARTSGSPVKKLKIGAPWKQSPPSRWSDAAGPRALAVDDVRHARDAADVRRPRRASPRPSVASTCVMTWSYGKRREWMSAVWISVRFTEQTWPGGQGRSTVSLLLEHAGRAALVRAVRPTAPPITRSAPVILEQKRALLPMMRRARYHVG